jgi:hypothetical protein
VSWYHRALQRSQGLQAGSPSAWEQLMKTLLAPILHHKGIADVETTHDDNATEDHYVFRIQQHNEGKPEEADWCARNSYLNRTPKSFALIVGKADKTDGTYQSAGDAHFKRDSHTERYAYGIYRWAVATADSVAGNPPTVAAIDEDKACQISGGVQISGAGTDDPGIQEGDRIAYILDNRGMAVTFSGGGIPLKFGTATANAREGATSVAVTNDHTGAAHTVLLDNTPAGQTPNIDSGNKVLYGKADDGNFHCASDYTDDPVGTMRGRPDENIYSVAWRRHNESIGRLLPHYGAEPYPVLLGTGGTITHTHDPHELEIDPHQLSFTSQEVVSSVSFNAGDCILTGNTTSICVLAGAN